MTLSIWTIGSYARSANDKNDLWARNGQRGAKRFIIENSVHFIFDKTHEQKINKKQPLAFEGK